jgi:hypothetical protein
VEGGGPENQNYSHKSASLEPLSEPKGLARYHGSKNNFEKDGMLIMTAEEEEEKSSYVSNSLINCENQNSKKIVLF